ncbi:MAG: tetratricopeptide repeat protein [Spirochaetales bacterium]|nr:tetratricopeptide repeat protein [Spirochaetales bacterium]
MSISVVPHAEIPLETEVERFTPGGGVGIDFDYKLPFFPLVSVCSDISYSYLPIYTGDGCNFIYLGGGAGFHFLNIGSIAGKIYGTAGYYHGIIADESYANGGNLYWKAGVQVGWGITPAMDIGVNSQYKFIADGSGGVLSNGISVGMSATFKFLQSRQLRIENIRYINIFPVMYKYYTGNSVGTVDILNDGSAPVENLEVSFFVAKYMDNLTLCPGPRALAGGKKATIDLYAVFAESVLDITEATVVSGKIIISYSQNKKRQTVEKSHSLRIYDRHAMTWDDNRKVSAYVTHKDPVIIDIAKSLARTVRNSGHVLDNNLGVAIALHESLKEYGITYVKDPTTPFVEFSKDKKAVDYIQFPRNTLHFKSGDCDDLSILYAAILQAVGIDTAFITIPGHIFMAFALSLPPKEAGKVLGNRKAFIVHDNRAWVPVEITSVTTPFLKAWEIGSLEWNESSVKDEAAIYPMYESWQTYEPVGYIGQEVNIPFISQDSIEAVYAKEMDRFIDRELYSLSKQIERNIQDNTKKYNKLGTIYARYGRTEKAKEYLNNALKKNDYFPAFVNLGNVYYLEKEYTNALSTYNKALKLKPDNLLILLQLARVYNNIGDYKNSGTYYNKLRAKSPEMAEKYAYLDLSASDETRAGSGEEVIEWIDE